MTLTNEELKLLRDYLRLDRPETKERYVALRYYLLTGDDSLIAAYYQYQAEAEGDPQGQEKARRSTTCGNSEPL